MRGPCVNARGRCAAHALTRAGGARPTNLPTPPPPCRRAAPPHQAMLAYLTHAQADEARGASTALGLSTDRSGPGSRLSPTEDDNIILVLHFSCATIAVVPHHRPRLTHTTNPHSRAEARGRGPGRSGAECAKLHGVVVNAGECARLHDVVAAVLERATRSRLFEALVLAHKRSMIQFCFQCIPAV